MKKELESSLYEYLGELLHQKETTFDWVEKDKVIRRLNAVYTLLDMDKQDKTVMEVIREQVWNL